MIRILFLRVYKTHTISDECEYFLGILQTNYVLYYQLIICILLCVDNDNDDCVDVDDDDDDDGDDDDGNVNNNINMDYGIFCCLEVLQMT